MVMAPFEVSIQDIFHGCDEESMQQQQIGSNGPFSAVTRSYLVDCILQEIDLDDLVSARDVKDMAKDFKKLASAKSESENKKGHLKIKLSKYTLKRFRKWESEALKLFFIKKKGFYINKA